MTLSDALKRGARASSIRTYGTLAALAISGVAFFLSYEQSAPAEDAVMLFDYSKNLASRGIITYGSGITIPIEGATDFLYMALIALISKMGISEFAASQILNYIGVWIILVVFDRLTRSFFMPLVAIIATPYLYSSLLGFSTMLFSATYVLCIHLVVKEDRRLYVSAFTLCLIRPDGVIWCIGLLAMHLLKVDGGRWKPEAKYLLMGLVVPGIAYFAWRLWYFREWLPIPFLVKSSGQHYSSMLADDALFPLLVPIVATVLFSENWRQLTRQLLLLFSVPILFYNFISLEQNIGNRFLAPLFFGTLLWLASQNTRRLTTGYLLLSICLGHEVLYDTWSHIYYSTRASTSQIALVLRQLPHGKLLSTEAGNAAYYSNWNVEDSWGLNTPRFAHRPIVSSDVAAGDYDLVISHCDLWLLKPNSHPSAPSNIRSWDNQCRELTGFIRHSDYDVFLVPVIYPTPSVATEAGKPVCMDYLIYAVSPYYGARVQLENVLRNFGGVAFNGQNGAYIDGQVCTLK